MTIAQKYKLIRDAPIVSVAIGIGSIGHFAGYQYLHFCIGTLKFSPIFADTDTFIFSIGK